MTRGITETAFASQVEHLLRQYGWRFMHIKPSIMQSGKWASSMNAEGKGWLDYLCLRPPRVLVIELKDAYSKITSEQEEWWADWEACQVAELYLWRPKDMDPEGGKILEVLR